jgi:prepilin-type N-terminal cleavage/methylation domain-containing protein
MTGSNLACIPARFKPGFTLAELLIALGILGVLATFTIPKVLVAQQNGASNAAAKEAAAAISQAFVIYKSKNTLKATTGCGDLTPYLNYVRIDTSTQMDDINNSGSNTCGGGSNSLSDACYILHNGAAIMYCTNADDYFGGTSSTNAIFIQVDPDGKYGGSTTGPSKSVLFYMYTTGRLVTMGTVLPGTITSGGVSVSAWAGGDPSWFKW